MKISAVSGMSLALLGVWLQQPPLANGVAAGTIDPPAPADLSWAAGAPKSEHDCAAENTFWVRGGTRDPSLPPPTGTRQDPFPAMTAKGPTGLADVLQRSRSKAAPRGHICILIDVPNPEDKVGFGSWYTSPYHDAGIIRPNWCSWSRPFPKAATSK